VSDVITNFYFAIVFYRKSRGSFADICTFTVRHSSIS